jgi:hypothetical protein
MTALVVRMVSHTREHCVHCENAYEVPCRGKEIIDILMFMTVLQEKLHSSECGTDILRKLSCVR